MSDTKITYDLFVMSGGTKIHLKSSDRVGNLKMYISNLQDVESREYVIEHVVTTRGIAEQWVEPAYSMALQEHADYTAQNSLYSTTLEFHKLYNELPD